MGFHLFSIRYILQQFLVGSVSFYITDLLFFILQFVLRICLSATPGMKLALWIVSWQPQLVSCATMLSHCIFHLYCNQCQPPLPSESGGDGTGNPRKETAPESLLPSISVISLEAASRFQKEIEALRQESKNSSYSRPDLHNRILDLQHELLMLMSMEVGANIRKIHEITEQLQGVNNIHVLRAMVVEEVENHVHLSEAVSKELVRAIARHEIAKFMVNLMRQPEDTGYAG